MELYPIKITGLHYVESGQFIVRFIKDFQATTLDPNMDPIFKRHYDSLMAQSPAFDKALMQIVAKSETDQLVTLDDLREKKIITLRRALSVYEHSDVTPEKQAYSLLKIVLKTYRNVENLNYEAESLATENLIAELRKPGHYQALQTLNLIVFVDNLETANINFINTFSNRSNIEISTEVFDTKLLRNNIFETYRKLAKYVEVMAMNKDEAFYQNTLKVLNNGRSYFANILAVRAGHQEKKKEENKQEK